MSLIKQFLGFTSASKPKMERIYTSLIVEKKDKILLLTFNNPLKKNALDQNAYFEIGQALRDASDDESITIVVFTGVGDYFTSGNYLSPTITDLEEYVTKSQRLFEEMLRAIVECSKVLVGLVNGPCIGIGATLCGLCDVVWASETAHFSTPFTKLGIVPEAASSYVFPHVMGRSRASEMLLFSEILSAEDALTCNFVSKVYKLSDVDTIIWPKLVKFSETPKESLQLSKCLIRMHEKDSIYKAFREECVQLNKRFYAEEHINALMNFMSQRDNKAKL